MELYGEGLGTVAISRVLHEPLSTVFSWVKKVCWAADLWLQLVELRAERQRGRGPAKVVISFDEIWTPYQVRGRLYVGVRRKDKGRCEAWIWTAVIEEPDGRRWVDFAVGDRSGETLLRLYARLPEAELYRSCDYTVYDWLPTNRHMVGQEPAPGLNRGSAVNRNEGLHSRLRDA